MREDSLAAHRAAKTVCIPRAGYAHQGGGGRGARPPERAQKACCLPMRVGNTNDCASLRKTTVEATSSNLYDRRKIA